jgi:23S rRNA (guanosine2251-2'-O)-methyltransferase
MRRYNIVMSSLLVGCKSFLIHRPPRRLISRVIAVDYSTINERWRGVEGGLKCNHTRTRNLAHRTNAVDVNDDALDTPSSIIADDVRIHIEENNNTRQCRKERLHFHLNELNVNTTLLEDAALRSVTTTDGFDIHFGKSAIKAYRSYIDPSPKKLHAVLRENVDIASNRYARQIDFLSKRHRSREAEWVRHIDTSSSQRTTFPLIIVLDNVRSAANVGSIFRSADACGCLEVITTGITPHPNGNGAEKLAKSALGAEYIVPSRHFATTVQLQLVGMETTERSQCYTSVHYPGPRIRSEVAVSDDEDDDITLAPGVALFLGNEVSGVDTEILPLLDKVIEIPMFGKKNSLNVAACAPVVMYEILRQWGVG